MIYILLGIYANWCKKYPLHKINAWNSQPARLPVWVKYTLDYFVMLKNGQLHYSDVIMSVMASQLFTQPFVQAQIKENIKAPRHWPLWGEFTGHRWIPHTKGQWRGKCFHMMMSSCYSVMNESCRTSMFSKLWTIKLVCYHLWLFYQYAQVDEIFIFQSNLTLLQPEIWKWYKWDYIFRHLIACFIFYIHQCSIWTFPTATLIILICKTMN